MKHTAKRLITYAKNGIVHVNDIRDPALRNIVRDKKLHSLLRASLLELGNEYDLLVPYAVDDAEKQLKRFVQYNLGEEVDLARLRGEYRKYYLRICEYGKPSDVLASWGLVPVSRSTPKHEIIRQLKEVAIDGVVWYIGRNSKLYRDIYYRSSTLNKSVTEYIEELGFTYKGGKEK